MFTNIRIDISVLSKQTLDAHTAPMFTSRWMKKKNAYDFQTLPVFLMPEIHTFQSFAFAFQTLLGEEWCIFLYLNFTHFSLLPLLSKLCLAKSDASPYILISHISVLCLVDKWSVKVTVVEHLRRSENTKRLSFFAPQFCKHFPSFLQILSSDKVSLQAAGGKKWQNCWASWAVGEEEVAGN